MIEDQIELVTKADHEAALSELTQRNQELVEFIKKIPEQLGHYCAHSCYYEWLHPNCQKDPCNSYKVCKEAEALSMDREK